MPIANLDALHAENTNPANFVLHEITDSCERLSFPKIWYPFERLRPSIGKKLSSVLTTVAIRSKKKYHPFERLRLSVPKNFLPFDQLELSVQNNCQPRYCSKPLSLGEPVRKCKVNNSSTHCWIFTVHFLLNSLLCFLNIRSSLRILIKTKVYYLTNSMFWPFRMQISSALGIHSIKFAYIKYHNLPLPLPGKQ